MIGQSELNDFLHLKTRPALQAYLDFDSEVEIGCLVQQGAAIMQAE
jgi:hypothetical protein